MKKLLIATGLIFVFLVATSIQGLAEDDVIYGCVGKKGKLRIVSDLSECKKSEDPVSLNSEDDVIYGCVGKKGKLRIVSDPSQCKKSQDPVSLNRVGPQGATGPQGPQGPAGGIVSYGSELMAVSNIENCEDSVDGPDCRMMTIATATVKTGEVLILEADLDQDAVQIDMVRFELERITSAGMGPECGNPPYLIAIKMIHSLYCNTSYISPMITSYDSAYDENFEPWDDPITGEEFHYRARLVSDDTVVLTIRSHDDDAADFVRQIKVVSAAIIQSAAFVNNETELEVQVWNVGHYSATYRVSVTDWSVEVEGIAESLIALDAGEIITLTLPVVAETPLTSGNKCMVTLSDPKGRYYDQEIVTVP